MGQGAYEICRTPERGLLGEFLELKIYIQEVEGDRRVSEFVFHQYAGEGESVTKEFVDDQ